MTTIGKIGPALADIMPTRLIFTQQAASKLSCLSFYSLPELFYPGQKCLTWDEASFDDKTEGLELFCEHGRTAASRSDGRNCRIMISKTSRVLPTDFLRG